MKEPSVIGKSARISRRAFLAIGGAALAAPAIAGRAFAQNQTWRQYESIRALVGDRPLLAGFVTLDLPFISEDGSSVPLSAAVSRPAGAPLVEALHIFAMGNPTPEVVTYHFTPISAVRPEIATRIRLNQSQTVVAIATTVDGQAFYAEREIQVTVSGCLGRADTYLTTDPMTARIRVPDRFAAGVPGEITTLINHPMETGLRTDAAGAFLPQNLVRSLTVTFAGETVFAADFRRSVAANPYLRFFVAPPASGHLVLRWEEDAGAVTEETVPLTVA